MIALRLIEEVALDQAAPNEAPDRRFVRAK
jgi:hypothetical protein